MYEDLAKNLITYCQQGKSSEAEKILFSVSPDMLIKILQFNDHECFQSAVKHGHVAIINKIIQALSNAEKESPDYCTLSYDLIYSMFHAQNNEGFIQALKNKDINTIKFLLEAKCGWLESDCLSIINTNADYIKFIWDLGRKDLIHKLFLMACYQSDEDANRLLGVVPKDFHNELFSHENGKAFTTSSIKTAELIWQSLTAINKKYLIDNRFPEILIWNAKAGNIDGIAYLLTKLNAEQRLTCLSYQEYNAFVYAADRGNVATVEFIYKQFPATIQPYVLAASNYAAYRLAMQNGHQSVINYLESIASNEIIQQMKAALKQTVLGKKLAIKVTGLKSDLRKFIDKRVATHIY